MLSHLNVLVHGYAHVDDRRVVGHLGQLADISSYVRRLAGLIEP